MCFVASCAFISGVFACLGGRAACVLCVLYVVYCRCCALCVFIARVARFVGVRCLCFARRVFARGCVWSWVLCVVGRVRVASTVRVVCIACSALWFWGCVRCVLRVAFVCLVCVLCVAVFVRVVCWLCVLCALCALLVVGECVVLCVVL